MNERKTSVNDRKKHAAQLTNIWNRTCTQASSDIGKTSRPCSKLESDHVCCAKRVFTQRVWVYFFCLLDAGISTDRSIASAKLRDVEEMKTYLYT